MKHNRALVITRTVLSFLVLACAISAHAQILYTGTDWTLDRGSVAVDANYNGFATRQGYNNFLSTSNDPQHSVQRWVWPATADLQAATGSVAGQYNLTTDNYNPQDPPAQKATESNGQQSANAIAQWNTGIYSIPAYADRIPYGGFSYITDPTNPNSFDYGVATPVQVQIDDGNGVPVTTSTLEALPYVSSDIYNNVNKALDADVANTAQYTMGTPTLPTTLAAGQSVQVNYEVQIWSPGDGTLTTSSTGATTPHPNIQHAFVRVSWNGTVNGANIVEGSGAAGTGGVDDPEYSRIFMVDLSGGPGWRTVGAYSSSDSTSVNPALFPYNSGSPNNQVTVTLYRDTPDNPSDTTQYANAPLITADAVQFVPESVTIVGTGTTTPVAATNLGLISSIGRILAPVTVSNQIAPLGDSSNGQNLIYLAREETLPSTAATIVNPTTTDLTPSTDITGSNTVPVFYCLNNMDEVTTTTVGGVTTQTNYPSQEWVRWRFVATPDAGTGTCIASPTLANVRTRKGTVVPMVFFVTTNGNGSLGHIYALDPTGVEPDVYNYVNVTEQSGKPPLAFPPSGTLVNHTTTCYWCYPSYRPLTGGANEPPNAPLNWEDPNVSLPTQTGAYSRFGPAYSFGPDQVSGNYFDGDIVATGTPGTPYIERQDTQITMGGMAWAPVIMNDPSNPTGPQILVVGAQNGTGGRIWAFDAGGRGDFTVPTVGTGPGVASTTKPIWGTTQRLWTWPHFGADAFHALNADTANGYTQAFNIPDDAALGEISGSLTVDPNYNTSDVPIMFGTSNGRVHAIFPDHDSGLKLVNGFATYNNRQYWAYPAVTTNGLGAGISTISVYTSSKTNTRYLLFNSDVPDGSGGRVYAIPEYTGTLGTTPGTVTPYWVYPPTPNPPYPDPNNPNTTAALDPGFGPSAPLALTTAALGTTVIPYDMVYVVQNDGTVDAIEADPVGDGSTVANQALYSQSGAFTSDTIASPTATQIIGQANNLNGTALSGDSSTPLPALVFSDNSGAITAVGLTAIPDGSGVAGATLLPELWQLTDSSTQRIDETALANNYLYNGDLGGQMRAYSEGTGTNGLGSTVPPSELLNNSQYVSVDLRSVDYYQPQDWTNFTGAPQVPGFTQTPNSETPAANTGGTNLGAVPISSTSGLPFNGVPADWGDTLYIAAWGVYHAEPSTSGPNGGTVVTGVNPPNLSVTFTIIQPGSAQRTTVTVPAEITTPPNAGWPEDIKAASLTGGYEIAGWDDNTATYDLLNSGTSANTNVFPWVATYQLTIKPDAAHPYTPGRGGVRVLAQATISQEVNIQTSTNSTRQNATYRSIVLRAGQRDYTGLTVPDGSGGYTTSTPNNLGPTGRGRPRPIFITNPLGLTTAGTDPDGATPGVNGIADNTGLNIPNTVGWAGSVDNGVTSLQDLFGNGSTIGWFRNFNTKALLAPLDMTSDGGSVLYQGENASGQRVPALYAIDRSAYYMVSGNALQFSVHVPSFQWAGGPSSVMNPLPWEQLPNTGSNGNDTIDYPAIPGSDVIVTDSVGTNVTQSTGVLLPPRGNSTAPNSVTQRIIVPTPLSFTINVPKYQPATVNMGPVSLGTNSFGASYTDVAGVALGQANPFIGPTLTYDNGIQPTSIVKGTFPALGYVAANITVSVQLPGRPAAVLPPTGFPAFGNQTATRTFTSSICVSPSVRLQVAQQTIDFGNEPAGTGYSDPVGGGLLRSPFQPSGVGVYQSTLSPWDTATGIGQFFQPFTLTSESNINLTNLRVTKLIGPANANDWSLTPNYGSANPPALPLAFTSSEVDSSISPWLLAVPFGIPGSNSIGPGIGNQGLVSSFDHAAASHAFTSAVSLYPINNTNILSGNPLGITADAQPSPWLHKPLPGDSVGTTATIPDVPHGNPNNTITTTTELGLPIPFGTPVGTYTTKAAIFEDETPIQWSTWLADINGAPTGAVNNDGILNTTDITNAQNITDPTGTVQGGVLEPTSNFFTLKVNVVENRLTNSVTPGSLSQIDLVNPLAVFTQSKVNPSSFNTLPALYFNAGGTNQASNPASLFCYWTSNRQASSALGPEQTGIDFSAIDVPYNTSTPDPIFGDSLFSRPGSGAGGLNAQWWSTPNNVFDPANVTLADNLFPTAGDLGLPGVMNPSTVRYGSPTIAQAIDVSTTGVTAPIGTDPDAYLITLGEADKAISTGEKTDSRIIYEQLNNGVPNGTPVSYPDSGQMPNSSVRPLLLEFAGASTPGASAQEMFYLFWSSAEGGHTRIFYNANTYGSNGTQLNSVGASVDPTGWVVSDTAGDPRLGNQVLPMPEAVSGMSSPSAIYRHVLVPDPFQYNGATLYPFDAIDVYFSGKLRGQGGVRIWMVRYGIYRGQNLPGAPAMKMGQLFILPLPPVTEEIAERQGDTNTFVTRDAEWYTGPGNGTGANSSNLTGSTTAGMIYVQMQTQDPTTLQYSNPVNLNAPVGSVTPSAGTYDPASGDLYFPVNSTDPATGAIVNGTSGNPILQGGTMVVDASAGTISFPNIPPAATSRLLVSYIPQLRCISVSRSDSNLLDPALTSLTSGIPAALAPAQWTDATGDAYMPSVTLDTKPNPRENLKAPQVVFGTQPMPVDRLWILYRKSDPGSKTGQTLYVKALRPLVRLPYPVQLNGTVGNEQIVNVQISVDPSDPNQSALGDYEVDWVRGRIYFTLQDLGRIVDVTYTSTNGKYSSLQYRVAWGDEISLNQTTTGNPPADITTQETLVPMQTHTNEGQVAVFPDPLLNRLWLFWSGTSGNSTDLYEETIAPQLYPTVTDQH